MPIIRLDYSGHYPSRRVEVTQEELEKLRELDKTRYIFDYPEGRELLKKLAEREEIYEECFTAYQ